MSPDHWIIRPSNCLLSMSEISWMSHRAFPLVTLFFVFNRWTQTVFTDAWNARPKVVSLLILQSRH